MALAVKAEAKERKGEGEYVEFLSLVTGLLWLSIQLLSEY